MRCQRTPSDRVRSFRPMLEALEDRTVLSNVAFTGVLGEFSPVIASNINQLNNLAKQFANDVAAFDQNPRDFNALVKLAVDGVNLESASNQLQQQVALFSSVVKVGEAFGLVTGSVDTFLFDTQAEGFVSESNHFQNLVNDADGDFVAALFGFVTGVNAQLHPPGSQTNGPVTETITNAPAVASSSGGPVTESVNVQNLSNSPVAVAIGYVATDGSSASTSDTCTNSTISLPLTVPASAPGVTGTWTVSVAGEQTQTNTTTYT
jgi:hypothetical protein